MKVNYGVCVTGGDVLMPGLPHRHLAAASIRDSINRNARVSFPGRYQSVLLSESQIHDLVDLAAGDPSCLSSIPPSCSRNGCWALPWEAWLAWASSCMSSDRSGIPLQGSRGRSRAAISRLLVGFRLLLHFWAEKRAMIWHMFGTPP